MLQTIKKHNLIEKDMHVIIGLSGGPDSVCLFDLLLRLAEENPEMNLKLYAVHVNHKFRPGAAEEDQRYVEELCRERHVPCRVIVTDCKAMAERMGISSEEAGRKARYDAFSQAAMDIACGNFGVASQDSCKLGAASQNSCEHGTCPQNSCETVPKQKIAIAVAHNANDQCETILFRMMRGSGTDGLAGMAYKRADENGFAVIRPILDLKRKDIEKYCLDRNLSPRIDHTNSENNYTRNKIRNMLIPYMEKNFNENITETINRLGKIASYDRDYLRDAAAKAYEEAKAEARTSLERAFYTEKLKALHKSIRTRIYTMALEQIGMEENVSFSHLAAADMLLHSDRPSASADMACGYKAAREYDRLVFINTKQGRLTEAKWKLIKMSRDEYESYKKEGRFHGAFCGTDIKNAEIRKRMSGDKIDIGNGCKKLQDFFVDEKLPKHYRDDVDVLASGNKVLWVMPSELYDRPQMKTKGRFSASFKVEDNMPGDIIVVEKL